MKYRILEKGEIVQAGDEMDASNNPWKDPVKWEPVGKNIGRVVSDPQYPAHQLFRRPIEEPSTE